MPKPISLQKATRELEAAVAGEPQQLWKVWPALPEGLPLSLVSRAMKRIVERNHDVGVIGRALPSAYIDTFLEVLAQKPAWPLVVAARSVVNVEASRRSVVLGRVLKCVEQLGVFSASRSQLEARVRVFVKDEHVVEAARQIVLHATFDELREFHRLMFVSLLMEDASEASMDALIAEAHEATKSAERIDRLRECLRWRKTPSPRLEPLRALLEARTEAGIGETIAALAKQAALARVPKRLKASFHGSASTKRGALSVTVHFDSDATVWWRAGGGCRPAAAAAGSRAGFSTRLSRLAGGGVPGSGCEALRANDADALQRSRRRPRAAAVVVVGHLSQPPQATAVVLPSMTAYTKSETPT